MYFRYEKVYMTRSTILDAPGKGFAEVAEVLKAAYAKKVDIGWCYDPLCVTFLDILGAG